MLSSIRPGPENRVSGIDKRRMDLILAAMARDYLPWNLDQRLLLPADMRDWLPEGHLALFILDVVSELDLSDITATYEAKDSRGRAGFHPVMMVALLFYAYCTGKRSSRKIEKATYDEVPYRVLSGDQHPDHDTIADFRKRHLKALAGLFVQVLLLCKRAGLVKLGHVSLDGTKVAANASKHKAMSYERMSPTEQRLQQEIEQLLEEAEQIDRQEDETHGKGNRGDELPKDLRRRQERLAKIRAAKAALEAEAREKAEAEAQRAKEKAEQRARIEQQTGKKVGGRKPQPVPDPEQAVPEPKAQRNFTDGESRIMPDGGNKGAFMQAYNAQIVVDGHAQVIVASDLTQQPNDKLQLVPMLELAKENLLGETPEKASADAGYYSNEAVHDKRLEGIDLYVPPDRQKHGQAQAQTLPADPATSAAQQMRNKLSTPEGKDVYRLRKATVEPVFGQIKEAMGFRRFSVRGADNAGDEWDFVCAMHNLLKLFRSGLGFAHPAMAAA
jgi:transposase